MDSVEICEHISGKTLLRNVSIFRLCRDNLGKFEIVLDGFAKRASGNIEVAGGDTLSKKANPVSDFRVRLCLQPQYPFPIYSEQSSS